MSDLSETSASTGPCPAPHPGFCGIESFLLESLPDLDECALQLNSVEEDPPARCQHLCHNYVGGYFCSCRPGYELQQDGRSCQGEVLPGWSQRRQGLSKVGLAG